MGILLAAEEDAISALFPRPTLLVEEQTAVDVIGLAGNEGCLLGSQEADHIGNVLSLSNAPQRGRLPCLLDDPGSEVFERDTFLLGPGALPVAQPIGIDRPRTHGV